MLPIKLKDMYGGLGLKPDVDAPWFVLIGAKSETIPNSMKCKTRKMPLP